MLRKTIAAAFCVIGLASSAALAQETAPKVLRIEADDWCPINCAPSEKPVGIAIGLVKKIYEPLGYRIEYKLVPWDVALKDVRVGRADAVVGANRADDPTLVFPKTAITAISDDFYVLKGNPWCYQGEYTLREKRLGVVAGYGYSPIIKKYIDTNRDKRELIVFASGDEAVRKNISNLLESRTHVLVESKVVMTYWIEKLNLHSKVEWAGGVPQDNIYVAFSPALAVSRFNAQLYDEGFRKLKAAGEIDRVYRRYGITVP